MHKQTELCWNEIVKELKLKKHDFSSPFYVKHEKIKKIVSRFADIPNNKKEIRILGSITKRENKPLFFKENNIFLLPSSNSEWVFLKGDGYFDPQYEVNSSLKKIKSDIKFDTFFGDSEGRYIHQINAQGILNDFTKTKKSVFTISGRRRAKFKSMVLDNNFEPARNLHLEQLTEDTCKYMEGHPDEKSASFCGRKTVEKFSYCPLHLMIVFQPKGKKDDIIDKEDEMPKFIEKKIKSA